MCLNLHHIGIYTKTRYRDPAHVRREIDSQDRIVVAFAIEDPIVHIRPVGEVHLPRTDDLQLRAELVVVLVCDLHDRRNPDGSEIPSHLVQTAARLLKKFIISGVVPMPGELPPEWHPPRYF